ncbi:hypothetical protein HYFRA_00013705 [Hymenoscyphus fraxineus]|uniref:Glucose-methanol-choline oxidoreductase N-terminal domain-containing protein n=1 Tax=Hymenoscyphus fraxineus TaxID=746836 RepID=A0A9N9LCW5_9HELO|nr:hypothetical protein HYFRA_00013705 [Hymenoscyphus fraxineus]
MEETSADYIIVGGGLTGCALATRLAQRLDSSVSILILEAGPDPTSNPNTTTPMQGLELQGSELDWAYPTAPTPSTANRVYNLTSGKTLGGGSILNYGGWARGNAGDYDAWAQITGDERWGYRGLLPYMKRSEQFSAKEATADQNGLDGPLKITGVSASDPMRRYPLREPLKKAWEEVGVQLVAGNGCSGSLAGISEFLETWDGGVRQPSHLAYGLAQTRVNIRTNTLVDRVLFERLSGKPARANGVLLADGIHIKANREVLLAAGALRSPQILQLSGVGPADMLSQHAIPLVHDSPSVGANLFDHFAFFQIFKLRDPKRGLALGHPALSNPAFLKGFPVDWSINEAVPAQQLQQALADDGDSLDREGLGKPGRTHVESLVMYHPYIPGLPVDGSLVATSVMLTNPTSRGSVGLASASPNDLPVIAPNYFSTSVDHAALVHGSRRLLRALTCTTSGKEFFEGEMAPAPGLNPLSLNSSDDEIKERIRMVGSPHYHPAGTCALGSVIDTNLKVKGVQGLRVIDASIFPAPLSGHPQATLYGVAELAAEIIAGRE